MSNSISYGKLVCERVFKSEYQKEGMETALLRQPITKTVQLAAVNRGLSSALFSAEELGVESTTIENETSRTVLIDVPAGWTPKQVNERLAGVQANIVEVRSNYPILSSSQKYACESEEYDITLDDIAMKQLVINPTTNEPHKIDGQFIYSVNVLDKDNRFTDGQFTKAKNPYTPMELAEDNGFV